MIDCGVQFFSLARLKQLCGRDNDHKWGVVISGRGVYLGNSSNKVQLVVSLEEILNYIEKRNKRFLLAPDDEMFFVFWGTEEDSIDWMVLRQVDINGIKIFKRSKRPLH